MNKLYIQDVTLRDGMHAIRHQYGLDHVIEIAKALDQAKVDAIEVAHGDGLSGSSFNYGFGAHTDQEWIGAVAEKLGHAKLTTLILPGIAIKEDLKWAWDLGVRSVRVATHCTEADVSKQHIEFARELGMDTIGFLMLVPTLRQRLAETVFVNFMKNRINIRQKQTRNGNIIEGEHWDSDSE